MISRNGFQASSSWFIRDKSNGAISLRWKPVDDGIKAELYQYTSPVDRKGRRKTSLFDPGEAYDRIIAAVGRFIEPQLSAVETQDAIVSVPLNAVELPADFDPDKLNFGKSVSVEGFAIKFEGQPDSILIATSVAGASHRSRKAEIVQLARTATGWADVPLAPDVVDVLSEHPSQWVKQAAMALLDELHPDIEGMHPTP